MRDSNCCTLSLVNLMDLVLDGYVGVRECVEEGVALPTQAGKEAYVCMTAQKLLILQDKTYIHSRVLLLVGVVG